MPFFNLSFCLMLIHFVFVGGFFFWQKYHTRGPYLAYELLRHLDYFACTAAHYCPSQPILLSFIVLTPMQKFTVVPAGIQPARFCAMFQLMEAFLNLVVVMLSPAK